MQKYGHPLAELVPQFPPEVRQKLAEDLSLTTAEEFLGYANMKSVGPFAKMLGLPIQLLEIAIDVARQHADRAFLKELERPVRKFGRGAVIDRPSRLSPGLARHLQQG